MFQVLKTALSGLGYALTDAELQTLNVKVLAYLRRQMFIQTGVDFGITSAGGLAQRVKRDARDIIALALNSTLEWRIIPEPNWEDPRSVQQQFPGTPVRMVRVEEPSA